MTGHRIVMLTVGEADSGTRTHRFAEAAAVAGWDVRVLGRSPARTPRERRIGQGHVTLVPVKDGFALRPHEVRPSWRRDPLAYPNGPARAYRRRQLEVARLRLRHDRLRADAARPLRRAALKARAVVLRGQGFWYRKRSGRTTRLLERRRDLSSALDRAATGLWTLAPDSLLWRRFLPSLWDWELAFGPEIDTLAPDLIHVGDPELLGVAARAKLRAAAAGRTIRIVWDAREPDPAGNPRADLGLAAYLREHAASADAVAAATGPLADRLAAEHRLPERPVVVGDVLPDPGLQFAADPASESQVEAMLAVYERLCPAPARPAPVTLAESLRAAAFPHRTGPVPWPAVDGKRVRLGLGTANSAGQLAEFARVLARARPDFGAESVMIPYAEHLRYDADVFVDPKHQGEGGYEDWRWERVTQAYTHLVADGFRTVFGRRFGGHVGDEIRALQRLGLPTALLAHGSEVRHPLRHLERNEFSAYRAAPADLVARLVGTTERNRRIADESGFPQFCTTPDLLDDLPDAVWVPVVVDVDSWDCDRPVFERTVPVVVHAPSNRWTKGTDLILPVLEDLQARGAIELRLLEGVAHSRMREFVMDADLVVDQIGIGIYGVLACEAMAAGKPVTGCIGETAAKAYGPDLPVLHTTAETLGATVASLLDDRDRARAIGAASRRYVREVHDGTLSAARFAAFLDGVPQALPAGS
ncbi:glycosyltransferase family 1 protein [Glycomyces sp. NPDC021274]|uniref:glycosyltransferase family 1 protein n=1 Tax=Glycomyces sp. NPDC021274 TaxID=3155120 RepID=UPI0033D194DC